jgi:hypothetical protein
MMIQSDLDMSKRTVLFSNSSLTTAFLVGLTTFGVLRCRFPPRTVFRDDNTIFVVTLCVIESVESMVILLPMFFQAH